MTERPIEDELREPAEQVVTGPDDVTEFAATHAETYTARRGVILGMRTIDAPVASG